VFAYSPAVHPLQAGHERDLPGAGVLRHFGHLPGHRGGRQLCHATQVGIDGALEIALKAKKLVINFK